MKYLLVLGVLFSTSLQAQEFCAPRQDVIDRLAQRWNEHVVARALANNGSILEVLSPSDRSTYTVIMTRPSGVSCVMSTGQFWSQVETQGTES